MGTNYYVVKNKCECCNRHDSYHIGKNSYGWRFSFRGYAWDNLLSWKQWKEFLITQEIQNEYGEVVPYEEFVKIVEGHTPSDLDHNTSARANGWFRPDHDWNDDEGYSFTTTEFS